MLRFSVTVRDTNDREWFANRDTARRALLKACEHMTNDHDTTVQAAGKVAQNVMLYGASVTSTVIVLNQFGFTVGVKEIHA